MMFKFNNSSTFKRCPTQIPITTVIPITFKLTTSCFLFTKVLAMALRLTKKKFNSE